MSDKIVLLPACTYPLDCTDTVRELELVQNIDWVARTFPSHRVVVADNGYRVPTVPAETELIFNMASGTSDASLGECRNIMNAIENLADSTLVLKLHARCKVKNAKSLQRLLAKRNEFLLASRNLLSGRNDVYDQLPYIDTRVMQLRAGRMRRLIGATLSSLEANGGRMERALLAQVALRPDDCQVVMVSGSFFPILSGRSGHGRIYSSPLALARSLAKSASYRWGI